MNIKDFNERAELIESSGAVLLSVAIIEWTSEWSLQGSITHACVVPDEKPQQLSSNPYLLTFPAINHLKPEGEEAND